MRRFLVVCLLAAALVVVANATVEPSDVTFSQFMEFTHKYGKTYSDPLEFLRRYDIFVANLNRVEAFRAQHKQSTGESGDEVYGVTKFMDLSAEEFRQRYLGFVPSKRSRQGIAVAETSPNALPTTFDWRKQTPKCVTAVKDQGQCGSCWAFSATEEVESAYALQSSAHTLYTLSEQQTVSCDTTDAGCDGGDTITAYEYMQQAGGIETEADYPYTSGGGDTGTCQVDTSKLKVGVSSYSYATKGCTDTCNKQNETQLAESLVANGPVSICVYAEPWQVYTGGVLSSGCPHAYSDLDHCVQLVGYDMTSSSKPYWIIRNSWNTDWGIDGYIYVLYGQNMCGVADEATLVKAKSA